MATVIVNPVSQISVRVGPGSPAQIQSTSQFLGASDQTAQIQRIYDVANTALDTANTALSQVGAAYNQSNVAFAAVSSAFIQANSAFLKANTAASDALAYSIALG